MPKKYRIKKLNELIKRELSDLILHELKDPRIKGIITVSEVEMAADLKNAKVYISIFGINDNARKKAFEAIIHSSNFLKFKLMKNIRLRYTPELHFYEDDSIEKGFNILEKLDNIKNMENQTDVETNGL